MNERLQHYLINATHNLNAGAVLAGIALVLASLIGNVSPLPEPGKFATFTSFFGLWLILVCILVIWGLLIEPIYVSPAVPAMHLALCGLMLFRIWGQPDEFPEIWVISGICLVTYIRQRWLLARPALPRERQRTARPQVGGTEAEAQGSPESGCCDVRRPRVRFAEVAGMQVIKERLLAAGQEVIQGVRSGHHPRNGILLTGKPGNGKTYLAEALAGELNLPVLTLTYGDVASKWIGDMPSRLPLVFQEARARAPCVLFFDEVDSLLSSRDTANTDGDSIKAVNVMLTELVDIRGTGVIVVAATNHLDRLDSAAVREGRFDFKIEIPPPDAPARHHLIQSHAQGPLAASALTVATERWAGFSVARITAILNEVNRRPNSRQPITYDDLQVALRTLQGRAGHFPENTPTLDQLVLASEARARLDGLAHRMTRIVDIEAMGGSVPHGVLFYGPPGTGKTLCARSLAKTAQWAFLPVSGLDLLSDPDRIEEILDEASELRPCVVFIDEADDVLADRRMSQTSVVTNKLLTAIDGSAGRIPDVMFIAATNQPEAMDAAALRGGRFTEKVAFCLPDQATVLDYLTRWQQRSKARLASELSLPETARQLAGQPLANVHEILQMAVNLAIGRVTAKAGVAVVNARDIDRAIVQVCGH
ncbi:MAG TPA: AAA family ATPase [Azonexus sp.]|nr:AAA family ATPase [Azonexus sp.]